MKNTSSVSAGATQWQTQRPLSEPVLESAAHELSAQKESTWSEYGPKSHGSGHIGGNGIDHSAQAWWSRLQGQVSEQVSQRPAQTALLAIGAGALIAWMLSPGLRRRRERD